MFEKFTVAIPRSLFAHNALDNVDEDAHYLIVTDAIANVLNNPDDFIYDAAIINQVDQLVYVDIFPRTDVASIKYRLQEAKITEVLRGTVGPIPLVPAEVLSRAIQRRCPDCIIISANGSPSAQFFVPPASCHFLEQVKPLIPGKRLNWRGIPSRKPQQTQSEAARTITVTPSLSAARANVPSGEVISLVGLNAVSPTPDLQAARSLVIAVPSGPKLAVPNANVLSSDMSHQSVSLASSSATETKPITANYVSDSVLTAHTADDPEYTDDFDQWIQMSQRREAGFSLKDAHRYYVKAVEAYEKSLVEAPVNSVPHAYTTTLPRNNRGRSRGRGRHQPPVNSRKRRVPREQTSEQSAPVESKRAAARSVTTTNAGKSSTTQH
jgi:hypothetical protein